MSSNLPLYVRRPGESCRQQPYACIATQLYGFYVRGDAAVIQQRLVDPMLNASTGGATHYRVLSDLVLVSYACASHCTSTLPPDSLTGWTIENSWTLWVPLVACKREFRIDVAERIVFYPAYICVDNSWSFAAGREVYGFPKCYGALTIPAAGTDATQLSVSTLVLKTFNPQTQAVIAPLMSIERTAAAPAGGEVWTDVAHAVSSLVHAWTSHSGKLVVPGLNLLVDIVSLLRHEAVPGVFLKQFRDAADGTRACYQAIIEANSSVTGLHSGGLLPGAYTATIAAYPSHPVASDLGLAAGAVPVELAFQVNFDFVIDCGKAVWQAGGGD